MTTEAKGVDVWNSDPLVVAMRSALTVIDPMVYTDHVPTREQFTAVRNTIEAAILSLLHPEGGAK